MVISRQAAAGNAALGHGLALRTQRLGFARLSPSLIGRVSPGGFQRPHRQIRTYVQNVAHPRRRNSLPQRGRHPKGGIPSHPLRLQVATSPRLLQHIHRQLSLAPVSPPRFRHPRRRTTLNIRCPFLGQIQPLVHQRPASRPHMRQKQPSLAVGDLPQRSTVLSDYSHRLHPLLGKVAAVQHPYRLRVLQSRTQIFLQPTDHLAVLPGRCSQKPLQRSGRCRNRLRKVFGVASLLGLHQQALQVLTAVLP